MINEEQQPKIEEDVYEDDEDIIQVNCNFIIGELHKKKFGSGSKGKCINVNGSWMTPAEFESYCGKAASKDWKRSIKCGGQTLLALIENNTLLCHAVSCSCATCSNDNSVIGPIRPFSKYRRRKKDEIQAQKAYKKFLSLKPPTLLDETQISKIDKIANQLNSHNTNNNQEISHSPTYNDIEVDTNQSSVKEIEELENKQWSLLEDAANMLIQQAQNLKNLIEQAKLQSKLTKKVLMSQYRQQNSYSFANVSDQEDDAFDNESQLNGT